MSSKRRADQVRPGEHVYVGLSRKYEDDRVVCYVSRARHVTSYRAPASDYAKERGVTDHPADKYVELLVAPVDADVGVYVLSFDCDEELELYDD